MDRVEMAIVEPLNGQDYWSLGALPLGVLLDCAFSFPKGWPGPVQAIGRLVDAMERGLLDAVRKVGGGSRAETCAGILLVTVVVGFVASFVWLTTEILGQFGGPPRLIGRAFLIYLGLSLGGLSRETLRISRSANLPEARRELARVEGLDPGPLDEPGVQRACVEFLGESVNEAVVAPLFWLAVAGPAGLWAYRAIEVLYRMEGSRKVGKVAFGRASVAIERLANVVSARVTWLLVALSAALLGEDGGAALRIGWRDSRKRSRPSVGWGLAAIAGALRVQFGGRSLSGSIPISRPIVGDSSAPIDRSTVRMAVRIVQVAGLHAAFLAWSIRIVLWR
jgi:adenosylcobinamide-phosphate synthase